MKKRTLKKELTILMMLASACTLLSACVAVFYVFFSFFLDKTQEDIQYVLNNTNQQYQSHMQFIEDGAVSIRHNAMLDTFFEEDNYDQTVIGTQLSYSMELFSDRNMIDRQLPFVTSVYLFNNEDNCIYEHYYASTLASEKEQESRYKDLQQQFKEGSSQYECILDEESVNLLFRIYDDDMQEKGICIAKINQDAISAVLSEVTTYSEGAWVVLFGKDDVIASHGQKSYIEQLTKLETVWNGKKSLQKRQVIGSANTCGFGIRTVIAVGQGNIFSILMPTMLIFGLGLIIVLAITVFVAFGTSYRFTKPVTRMIESIRAFGKQDFDVRMEDSSIQEFHDIGTVFNEMAERIKYLIMQVYEKQLLATQSQVKYLQAQINPHFQFNILAMLSLKAKMAGNEEVYGGLQAFSKLMQGKIFREKEIKIKVSEELEIVRFYLYLQKSRYQDKLSYEIVIEDESINQDMIPRLLIEPLVENSVSHGLEPKRENGTIQIHLYESNELPQKEMRRKGLLQEELEDKDARSDIQGMLHICIEDDGVGFDTEKIEENDVDKGTWDENIEHTHTGLENTKRMLQILYGSQHEFRISGGKGRGTRVEIVLPVERGGNYVENHGSR